jgi:hypothetical protein
MESWLAARRFPKLRSLIYLDCVEKLHYSFVYERRGWRFSLWYTKLNLPANSLQKNTAQHHISLHTLLNTEDPKVQERSPWLPCVVLGIRALKSRWGLRDGCASDRVALQVDEIVSTYVSLAKYKQKKQSLRWDIDGYKRLP